MDAHRAQRPSIQLQDSSFDRKSRDFSPMAPLSEPPSRRSSSSEYATPISPTFSNNGHQRLSSSSTTLSSSPTMPESAEVSPFIKEFAPELPDVAEDPLERDGSPPASRSAAFSFGKFPISGPTPNAVEAYKNAQDFASRWSHDVPAERAELTSYYLDSFAGRDSDFFSDSEAPPEPLSKRRRSGELPRRSLTDRVMGRFSSLSRKRTQKRSSIATNSEPCSGLTSPTGQRSRSNSRARSLFRRSAAAVTDDDYVEVSSPNPNGIGTITEDEADEYPSSFGVRDTDAESISGQSERPVRVSTPLLPHLMGEPRAEERENCALHEPTVAPCAEFSALALSPPALKPQPNGKQSPALSSQPSLSAIHHSHLSAYTNTSGETPPSTLSEDESQWSNVLGHADFHIQPAPYMPASGTFESYQQLLADWEQARRSFGKHLCQTSIDYGDSSKTYRLTQEKWEWLDSIWRKNFLQCRATAMKNGEVAVTALPLEPAPVLQVPTMDDKFPMLSDHGAVGPMEQAAPQPQGPTVSRRSSTKQTIMRKIGSIRRRGRSTSGVRNDD